MLLRECAFCGTCDQVVPLDSEDTAASADVLASQVKKAKGIGAAAQNAFVLFTNQQRRCPLGWQTKEPSDSSSAPSSPLTSMLLPLNGCPASMVNDPAAR